MTRKEFSEVLEYHGRNFPGWWLWLSEIYAEPTQRRSAADQWHRALFSEIPAKRVREVSDQWLVEETELAFGRHLQRLSREARRLVDRLEVTRALEQRQYRSGAEETFVCRWCLDTGHVEIAREFLRGRPLGIHLMPCGSCHRGRRIVARLARETNRHRTGFLPQDHSWAVSPAWTRPETTS